MRYIIVYFCIFCFIIACQTNSSSLPQKAEFELPYNLNEPDKVLTLDESLRELSGIDWLDKKRMAIVQDEAGKAYIISSKDGEVLEQIKFAKDADFEGITYDGKYLTALRSDGKIYRFLPNEKKLKKQEWHEKLEQAQDCEGIAWQTQTKQFWIAAKGKPINPPRNKGDKAIYSFDPSTEELEFQMEISQDILKEKFGAKEKFAPSGLAFTPKQDKLYIVSSAGKALLVMSLQGNYLAYHHLSRELLTQPEGICFSPDGKLIIASEGRKKKAKILIFEPK